MSPFRVVLSSPRSGTSEGERGSKRYESDDDDTTNNNKNTKGERECWRKIEVKERTDGKVFVCVYVCVCESRGFSPALRGCLRALSCRGRERERSSAQQRKRAKKQSVCTVCSSYNNKKKVSVLCVFTLLCLILWFVCFSFSVCVCFGFGC